MNTKRIVCGKRGWLVAISALSLWPVCGCSDAESQKILAEANSKPVFAAKAPPQPAPPVGKAAVAANAAAPANNAAQQAAAAAVAADPDAGPADVAAAQNAITPAANPAAATPPVVANPAAAPQAASPPAAAAPAEGGGGFFSNLAKGVSDKLKKPADQPAAQPQQPAGDPANQVKAGVGVGKKGRGYGGGLVAAAVHARFSAEERIIFEAQIPNQMQTYKALHDGAPKTHEQFMKEIIEAAEIRLPELPAGDRYIYDPKTEQLMVETAK